MRRLSPSLNLGAGRKLAERYLFTEVAENLSLYRLVDHQHVPEIELALSRISGTPTRVVFAPHLLPIRRGLIATCYATLAREAAEGEIEGAFRDDYRDPGEFDRRSIVEVCGVDAIDVHRVTGTASALVGAKLDPRSTSVVAACALDNLMKGAASQAWENLRRMVRAPRAFHGAA